MAESNPTSAPDAVKPPREELACRLIRSGHLTLDAEGRFWRIRRAGSRRDYPKPRRIDRPDPVGYCRFGITWEGQHYTCFAHRVVWHYHNGPLGDGLEINHVNGNKADNRIENLEAVTHQQNMHHAGRTLGKMARCMRGEAASSAKLTWDKVREIRRLWALGLSKQELGKRFGVHESNIGHIVRGRSWREEEGQG